MSASEKEIEPEMLKALNRESISLVDSCIAGGSDLCKDIKAMTIWNYNSNF